MNLEQFIEELDKLNIKLSDIQLEQLHIYYEYLVEYNCHTNLTAITDKNEVYLKHFYDSLTIVKYVDMYKINNLIDIGTGAGFPGMVLKIVYPSIDVSLLDSNNKKLKFLDDLIDKCRLVGVRTIYQRSEDFAKNNNFDKFDLVVSRAVAALPILSEICLPLVKVNGLFVALKGSAGDKELNLSNDIVKKLNGKVVFDEKFNLPISNDPRTIIGILKIKNNPVGYPRDYGKIKKDYNRLTGNK